MANLLAAVAARTGGVVASTEIATAERLPPPLGARPSVTRTADGREAVANRMIVAFKAGVSATEKNAVHRSTGTAPVKQISASVEYVDTTGAPSLEAALASYRADPRVRYAEPDYIVHALDLPNDQYFGDQYGMTKVQAPGAWSVTHGSGDVRVAILDCGIYEAHPDLAGKVIARHDFTGSASGTDDRCDHGTHVAGIAGADTNNTTGVAGLGYDTRLLNGKVLDDSGSGYDSQIAEGIRWAADNGARVINMSLGGYGPCSQTFQDAIDYAWSKNVVIVAAAGNGGANVPMQPADCAHVIAVASTDASDTRSGFSSFGGWVALAAPGSAIYSTVNPNLPANNGAAYAYLSGTSMATPHVAGLAALIWSTPWGTSAQAVVQRMETTADRIPGTGTSWQYGRINAMAAVAPDTAPPTITALTPNTAVAGSTGVTLAISGSDFRPGAVVRWNGVSRPASSVMPTRITASIAAADLLTVGTANVAVVNLDGTTSAALTFTIAAAPPQPAAVAPAAGPDAGGTTVRISGAAFQPGATVTFGGVTATVRSVTGTAIVVTAPAHAMGPVNVVVTNPDGQHQTLPNGFSYTGIPASRPGPAVPSATPSAGPLPRPAPVPVSTSPAPSAPSAPSPAPAPVPFAR